MPNDNILSNGSHAVTINVDPYSTASNGFIVGEKYLINPLPRK